MRERPDSAKPKAGDAQPLGCGEETVAAAGGLGVISIKASVLVGALVGWMGGTFFAAIIAAVCMLAWLIAPAGITGSQVARSGGVLVACIYVLSIAGGVRSSLKRRRRAVETAQRGGID